MRPPSRLPKLTTDLPTTAASPHDVEQTDFDCDDVGANYGDLDGDRQQRQSKHLHATITVEDNIDPTAICQNLTVQLDATVRPPSRLLRLTTVLPTTVASLMTLSQTTSIADDVGANTVTLTVTDNNGNVSTCTATITVEDNIDPTAICQNLTVQLDATVRPPSRLPRWTTVFRQLRHRLMTLSQTDFDCDDVGCEYGDLDGDRQQRQS